jgi:Big-like domain-containing protein/subtilase family protein
MKPAAAALILTFMFAVAAAASMDTVAQFPDFATHVAQTTDPLLVQFDQSLNTATADDSTFYVTELGDTAHVSGTISFDTTDLADDTVVFTPGSRWKWGVRYQVQVTSGLTGSGGDAFDGSLPYDGIFVANIPNDFRIPIYDPGDPLSILDVDTIVLMGYNPMDPEAFAQPWEIPGLNVTGGWKYGTGSPDVIVAILDNGVRGYDHPDIRKAFFLNQGELPLPNENGTICADYDCNDDGRFDVDDYALDNRLGLDVAVNAMDLIETFSDGVDDDGNGLIDDISGWDFLRDVNEAIGVSQFPEGVHGDGEAKLVATAGDDGSGSLPGICPDCRILPIRACSGLIYEYNIVAAGARYASEMGAQVINFAGANFTWSEKSHQAFVDALDNGALTAGASGDEMTFHHWMPAAGEGILNIKTIFPMVPVPLAGQLGLDLFGFTETFCTNYGTHTHLSVPARTGCTSDSTGNTSGMLGLLFSYAQSLGIDLTADEAKQIMTMTADDVQSNCATIVNLLGVCQPGFDEHFAYGRPDMERALLALGDPDLGIDPAIPPAVRIYEPLWWEVIDPVENPDLQVMGMIDSRVTPFDWEIQVAKGNEPREWQFVTLASGTSNGPIDGLIATIALDQVFSENWATGTPQNQYTFEGTLRVRAYYDSPSRGTILGEARKSIGVHVDSDPDTGLMPGFPIYIGSSGESAPMLYDLDGDIDNRLEIVFGGSDGTVHALKYDSGTGEWDDFPGFPVDVTGDHLWVDDGIFASLAAADFFGDGTPEIVVATTGGKVYVLDPALAATTDPILPGFPLSADAPDNSSTLAFAHGNGFFGSPAIADLNADGVLDIVVTSQDQYIYAFTPDGGSGTAARLSGWPVHVRSKAGAVDPNKICQDSGLTKPIYSTPAIGILDPDSSDTDIAENPSVVVSSPEACTHSDGVRARIYAIYHDGNDNSNGPFLPGWPATPVAPLGDSVPIPIAAGSPSSPALMMTDEGAKIAIGSTAWLPQVLTYKDGVVTSQNVPVLIAVNVVGSPAFSSIAYDGEMQLVTPLMSALRFDELGFQLFNSKVYAVDVKRPNKVVIKGDVEDMPLLVTASVADLDNDGKREIVAGTGGYLVHAYKTDGTQAPDWPKYTQKWVMAAPAIGDADRDGKIEIITHTREGWLYGWESTGEACPNDALNSDWRRFHHDERNTGNYDLDTLPPSRITDLTATVDAYGTVTLSFTAPGDDWGCGQALEYDIRYSDSASADLSDPAQFETATQLATQPTPSMGGEVETLQVELPTAQHFAIRTVDEAGNLSFISVDAPVEPEGDDDDDDDDNDTTDDDDDDDDTTDDDDDNDDNDASPDEASAKSDDDDDSGCGC